MKRPLIYTLTAALVVLGIIVAVILRASDDPVEKHTSPLPELVIPASVPKPSPVATPTAAEQAVPPPPVIADIETKMRKTPVNRPMNEIGKNWFGCVSESSYNDTLTLLNQKAPSAADRFKGEKAECSALQIGWHVKVLQLNAASSVAQISVDETRETLWTDSSALNDSEPSK